MHAITELHLTFPYITLLSTSKKINALNTSI